MLNQTTHEHHNDETESTENPIRVPKLVNNSRLPPRRQTLARPAGSLARGP